MIDTDYTRTQDRLVVMADFVRSMDLEAFMRRMKSTRKLAPILDTAIYIDLRDHEAIMAVARAALDFKTRLEAIRREWRQRRSRRILKGEHD